MKSSSCTAAQVSLLTVYDMCEAVDRMVMSDIRVMESTAAVVRLERDELVRLPAMLSHPIYPRRRRSSPSPAGTEDNTAVIKIHKSVSFFRNKSSKHNAFPPPFMSMTT